MKIVKIPYSEGTDRNKGCEKAPNAIVEQLDECWTNEDFQDKEYEIVDSNINELKEGDIFVGGDHTISYHIFKKFLKDRNAGILVFDSHPDLYQHFEQPIQTDWLYFLIKEKIVKAENVILVGIRNADVKEVELIKKYGIRYISTKQLFNNLEDSCDIIMELVRGFNELYISIDIDVLDPAFAPGTGYIEPAGLSSRELLYLLGRIKLLKNIKKYDLVEVNPDKDFNNMTSKIAARIIKELI